MNATIDYDSLIITTTRTRKGFAEMKCPYGFELAAPFFVNRRLFEVEVYDGGWVGHEGLLKVRTVSFATRREAAIAYLKLVGLVAVKPASI